MGEETAFVAAARRTFFSRAIFGHIINETNNEFNISMSDLPGPTFSGQRKKKTRHAETNDLFRLKKKGGKNNILYFLRRYTSPACAERGTSSEQRQRGVSRVPIPRSTREKKDQTEGKRFRLKSRNTRSYIYRQTREKLSRD